MGRRARQLVGGDLRYCIYDKARGSFREIDPDLATAILDQRVLVQSGGGKRITLNEARRGLRTAALALAPVYQVLQWARGRRFTRDDVRRLQMQAAEDRLRHSARKEVIRLDAPRLSEAALDQSTTIISGGLDWEHKDLRRIWTMNQQLGFRYCTIVHDLVAVSHPHLVVPAYIDLLREYFSELVWVADVAMCVSRATERDWLDFCTSMGVEAPRTHVFPLGSDMRLGAASTPVSLPESLDGKRFGLVVSTLEPRKNHRTLYEAWDFLVRAGRVDPQRDRLVFVGRQGWAVDDLVREMAINPATRDSLVVLNQVSDDLLALLYAKCALTLLPSHHEGYGLPVAEALGHGKPCISSDAGALPEIGGDLVLRLSPKDVLAWADAIATYLTDGEAAGAWAARIRQRHEPVTWQAAADRFFGALQQT